MLINRAKYVNYSIILMVFIYGIYRIYEIVNEFGVENLGGKIFTVTLLVPIVILFIFALQHFRLFLKWQPFIVSFILFAVQTAGSLKDGEFGLYFNILTVISIVSAFYLSPKNYLFYFLASGVVIAFLYFNDIIVLHEEYGIIYGSATLLAWVFYEIITLGVLFLITIVQWCIYRVEKRDEITMDILAHAAELRDDDTGSHLLRTTRYAQIIITALLKSPQKKYWLTDNEIYYIVNTVKLHDVGKIAIPDAILHKSGKLSDEEFEIIKAHTKYGANMFEKTVNVIDKRDKLFVTAYNIAYGHHEKWDGSGYPRGLSGFSIPLCARIAAVADVFDALTTKRPYKRAFSAREAFDILYDESGTHFDPYIIEIVRKHEKDFIESLAHFNS